MKYILLTISILLFPTDFRSENPSIENIKEELEWVDKTIKSMSLDEKLGQLFMIRAFSKGDFNHEKKIEALIKEEKIGGLCFFQGTPIRQVQLTNRYQSLSKIPLLISIDAEWGLGMRFKNHAISFPKQLTLGAIKDNRYIYDMGIEIAGQLSRMGIHINFAPVVDINNNPENPVINDRSFGEGKYNVTAKSFAYMRGLQDGGIISCAKHFPGHGDTDTDSHLDLPIIKHNRDRLDSLELFPFKVLSQHGIQSMMIAHLSVPALDSTKNMPTTLSKKVVSDLLKKEIGFDGLVITDALDMHGVTKHHEKGQLDALAFEAGNDILLLSEDVKLAKKYIKKFIGEGRITKAQVDKSVRKILRTKYRLGLNRKPFIKEENLSNDIITVDALSLKGKLYENALTLVRDNENLVPVTKVIGRTFGAVSFGVKVKSPFQKRLESYASVSQFNAGLNLGPNRKKGLIEALSNKDVVFISIHNYNKSSKNYNGIGFNIIDIVQQLSKKTKVILTLFGSPYALQHFEDVGSVIMAYETDELSEDFAGQAVFGVFGFKGILPVNASPNSPLKAGIDRKGNGRLGYVLPEVVGLNSDTLDKMDALAEKMIAERASPGCQILVAKQGRVVFYRSYGYHDYNKKRKVQLNDVYDLASITKIAATTIALMKLQDEGKINVEDPLSKYLPSLDTSNKARLTIKDVLGHHAGLRGWIAFYESTKNGSRLDKEWYRTKSEPGYEFQVCEDLFIKNDAPDTILQKITSCSLREKNDYRYSDLGFYLFERIIQNITGQTLDDYCRDNFYRDLGLRYMGYNPIKRGIPIELIPPTEKDNYFRTTTIQGYVHDMGAAMQGGVAGHAGLFANAHDLAILMQMLLNKGEYGGKQYLKPETVKLFTTRHPRSTRRALGFDMKELNGLKTLNMSSSAPQSTFGHLGFTGTCTWVDPDNELVYVFLSNRTYPSMKNNKLNKDNYRPNFQSIIYESLIE